MLVKKINYFKHKELPTYNLLGGFFMFGDNFFKRVEDKTNVNKDTILSLAQKLQNANMKDETTIREVISEISNMTGKEVSKEKEDKIVNAIIKDNIPKNIDQMF